MALALDQFIQRISDSCVMSKEDIAESMAALPSEKQPHDGAALAKLLVRNKELTAYQAQQIYAGKGKLLVLGNYLILDKIGAGGMGQVFKARHKRMNRIVTVKLLPPELNKDEAIIKRFHREAEAAAKLNHPNIVIAHDADEAPGGIHFLVMEYVEGRDLAQVLQSESPLSIERALDFVLQAARGLEFAHENGVVHRDIKPGNLLLDAKGVVKILDMGLARVHDAAVQVAHDELTKSGDMIGTVDYMAPEQAFSTHTVDGRADIYSLGCTWFRLLTYRHLYEGDSIVQKLTAHQSQPIPRLRQKRPDVPIKMETIFERMVAKRPDDRYQSMTEVIADLEAMCETMIATSTEREIDCELGSRFDSNKGSRSNVGDDSLTSAFHESAAVADTSDLDASPTISIAHALQPTAPISENEISEALTVALQVQPKRPSGPWWRNHKQLDLNQAKLD